MLVMLDGRLPLLARRSRQSMTTKEMILAAASCSPSTSPRRWRMQLAKAVEVACRKARRR
jgi:hypothetical protein